MTRKPTMQIVPADIAVCTRVHVDDVDRPEINESTEAAKKAVEELRTAHDALRAIPIEPEQVALYEQVIAAARRIWECEQTVLAVFKRTGVRS